MIADAISAEDRMYREFACWAARRAARIAKCKSDYPIVLAVEQYLLGKIGFDEVRKEREFADSGARGASVCGIPRRIPSAAAQIAASCCADDSAKRAAENVIQFGAMTASFATSKYNRSAMGKERAFLEAELRNRLESL